MCHVKIWEWILSFQVCFFQIPIGSAPEERANLTTPPGFKVALSSIPGAGMGAWTEIPLSKFTILGSYEGLVRPDINEKDPYSWVVSLSQSVCEHISHFILRETFFM